MNLSALTLFLLSTGAPALTGAPQATDLRFDPAPGTRLSKTITVKRDLNLDEMGRTTDHGPLEREDVGGWVRANTRQKLVDAYYEVADGRPNRFQRTFSNFEGTTRMTLTGSRGQQEHITKFRSPIAGFPVLYTWVPGEQGWGRCFDYLAYEEDQLEELLDDADFLGLLPADPVQPGASWEASTEALRALLTPGGNTGAEPSEQGYFARMVEVGVGGDLADILGELSGVVTVTFREVREREEDGRPLAVLDVDFSVTSVRDRTRTYIVGMPEEEQRESTQLEQVLVTWIANGKAELLWDLEGRHAAGASVRGDEVLSAEIFKLSPGEDGPVPITQRTTYSGKLKVDHAIKPAGEKEGFDPEAEVAAGGKGKRKKRKRGK